MNRSTNIVSFEQIMQENKRKAELLAKEKLESNKQVLISYKIKGGKG